MTTRFKLGKKPARPGAVKLTFAKYVDHQLLPSVPPEFGHQGDVSDWLMLANDQAGDCAEAGAWHETMLWNAEVGNAIAVDDQVALGTYTAVTGYDPSQTDPATGENPTDQGTDPVALADYRRSTGLTDGNGTVHKIGAYLALAQSNVSELRAAIYLFSAVGIGLQLPDSAQDQFQNGQPWSPVSGSTIEGGHYVAGVGGLSNGNVALVTWGAIQQMTPAFYRRYNDQSLVYLSEEFLSSSTGKSPEGFDLAQLQADLAALGN